MRAGPCTIARMVRRGLVQGLGLVAIVLALGVGFGCGDDAASSGTGATGASSNAVTSGTGGSSSSSAGGGGAPPSTTSSSGGGPSEPVVTATVVTHRHRFVPGSMFGGWGPHLGHLVRAGGALFFVDDVCSQAGSASDLPLCDVDDNHTIGVHRLTEDGWVLLAVMNPPGVVQQNTATIASADGTRLHTYGVDSGASTVVECTFVIASGAHACAALPIATGPFANYVGAAVSPLGHRMVWWTGVVDGGGGSFHFVVDYGGGWNGPRSGGAAGYNDASYVNLAFDPAGSAFTLHAQLVGGLAPNWTFHGATGSGDLAVAAPVTFATDLAAVEGDAMSSTNDVWIDPDGDTHLLARSAAGKLVYFHRPVGGTFSPVSWWDATFRGRFVPFADRLAVVFGPNGQGLRLVASTPADVASTGPVPWSSREERALDLPAELAPGFSSIFAIYPAAPPTSLEPSDDVDVVVVGTPEENVALHVRVQGL